MDKMNFKEAKALLLYLKDPCLAQDGQEAPLYAFPQETIKQDALESYAEIGADLFSSIKEHYQNPELDSEKIKMHLLYLGSVYACSRLARLVDFRCGLNTRKLISIEDYIKFRPQRIQHFDFQDPKTKAMVRKSRSQERQSATKSAGRVRGISLHSVMHELKATPHEKSLARLVPLDSNRVEMHVFSRLLDLRVIADALRILGLHDDKELVAAACFWLNHFLLAARLPLPTRDPHGFADEMKSATVRDYLRPNSAAKFGKAFWQNSLYKRHRASLPTNHQGGLDGPVAFDEHETTSVTLANCIALNTSALILIFR